MSKSAIEQSTLREEQTAAWLLAPVYPQITQFKSLPTGALQHRPSRPGRRATMPPQQVNDLGVHQVGSLRADGGIKRALVRSGEDAS